MTDRAAGDRDARLSGEALRDLRMSQVGIVLEPALNERFVLVSDAGRVSAAVGFGL